MHLALTWLKEEDAPLGEMASRLGYESEAAFSRASSAFSVSRRARFDGPCRGQPARALQARIDAHAADALCAFG
jgi:AraC-like DNA-binding protein